MSQLFLSVPGGFFLYFALIILLTLGFTLFIILRKHLRIKKELAKSIPEKLEILNNDLSTFGFAYFPPGDYFYSLRDCWQRKFGYQKLFDEAAAGFNMLIDCEPVYFTYDEKYWMIEFWKGQYGITTGAEVGIYYLPFEEVKETNPDPKSLRYKSIPDSQQLAISYTLFADGQKLLSREDTHWWLTSFRLGSFMPPSRLEMEISLTFPSIFMKAAFLDALIQLGYTQADYRSSFYEINLRYTTPHSAQPVSRTPAVEISVLSSTKFLCKNYNKLTKNYQSTLDKLIYLRTASPVLYKQILAIAKTSDILNPKGEDPFEPDKKTKPAL